MLGSQQGGTLPWYMAFNEPNGHRWITLVLLPTRGICAELMSRVRTLQLSGPCRRAAAEMAE